MRGLTTLLPLWNPCSRLAATDPQTLTPRPPTTHPASSTVPMNWILLLAAGWPALEYNNKQKFSWEKMSRVNEELFLILFLGKWNFWTNSHCCCWFLVILKVTFVSVDIHSAGKQGRRTTSGLTPAHKLQDGRTRQKLQKILFNC